MKILSIETSCDETGISILQKDGDTITLIGNALTSQIDIHAQYGGVFPMMAKRAHAEKITLLIEQALDEAFLLDAIDVPVPDSASKLSFLDEKESLLRDHLVPFLTYYQKPAIDYIAVTVGPGLEPALWVGINTARALSTIWGIPIIPINHMEGHIVTAAITELQQKQTIINQAEVSEESNDQEYSLSPEPKKYVFQDLSFPVLALLVSGGHTELVLSEGFGNYKKIGQTRDDAVGEAFDKVARVLGLPYPGGPAVSKLAASYRTDVQARPRQNEFTLPRPMMHSGDYDFSFSGIKTAVLYASRDLIAKTNQTELTDDEKMALACEFETAAIEVLVKKTITAAKEYHTPTIIVGGGVAGNTYLRAELIAKVQKELPGTTVLFPEPWLATDNAVMIGLAAMTQVFAGEIKTSTPDDLKAEGNLSL